MSFLFIAVPIAILVILFIFITVFVSDSKGYTKKLDNFKQMELEKAKKEAQKMIDEMKKIKNQSQGETTIVKNYSNKKDTLNNNKSKHENLAGYYADYIKKSKKKAEIEKSTHSYEIKQDSNVKLKFSKENIVRGLVAKEYLYKREVSRKV